MSDTLVDGVDSGAVPDRVKLQVFVDGIGICAAPDCSERIVLNRTKLGECAHIIPRVVGSHPREDHLTPPDERRKESNLLYLCRKHHDLVDDKEHADRYTAEELRRWKRDHEAWAAGVKKDSPYLPPELKSMLASFEQQIAAQASISQMFISNLLRTTQEFLDRYLINEANVILSQIEVYLLEANNESLNVKADLLGATLLVRNEQISEAKKRLLQIIKDYPHAIEPMLEYIELCDNVPEPDDDVERIERIVRTLANTHPRLALIDLTRKFKKRETVEIQDTSEKWADDVRLNAKFICTYALFCDLAQMTTERDELINRWERELPNSPRPHLFKVLFRGWDILRSSLLSPIEKARLAQEVLTFSRSERAKSAAKDPLSVRDKIAWLMQEIRLEVAVNSSGTAHNAKDRRDDFLSLIDKCYFDSFINGILLEFMDIFRIQADQWRALVRKLRESHVSPSQAILDLMFLQTLEYKDLYIEVCSFVEEYGQSDLLGILQAISGGDIEKAAERINAKNDSIFSLYLLESIAEDDMAIALSEQLEVDENH